MSGALRGQVLAVFVAHSLTKSSPFWLFSVSAFKYPSCVPIASPISFFKSSKPAKVMLLQVVSVKKFGTNSYAPLPPHKYKHTKTILAVHSFTYSEGEKGKPKQFLQSRGIYFDLCWQNCWCRSMKWIRELPTLLFSFQHFALGLSCLHFPYYILCFLFWAVFFNEWRYLGRCSSLLTERVPNDEWQLTIAECWKVFRSAERAWKAPVPSYVIGNNWNVLQSCWHQILGEGHLLSLIIAS